MTNFDKINRRSHLYLGLFLMPWLLMYGVSSFIVIHQPWFGADQARTWAPVFEKEYRRPVSDTEDLRAVAQEILKDCDLEGAFWADKPKPGVVHIDRFSFWGSTRLTYSIKEQKIKAEHQQMKWPQAVMRMHFRGGYEQPSFWNKFWGVVVDTACVGILVWVASGLIMWWRLPGVRAWGAVAVGGGFLSFLLLIWKL